MDEPILVKRGGQWRAAEPDSYVPSILDAAMFNKADASAIAIAEGGEMAPLGHVYLDMIRERGAAKARAHLLGSLLELLHRHGEEWGYKYRPPQPPPDPIQNAVDFIKRSKIVHT